MAEMLLGLGLEGVIRRVSAILNRRERTKFRERPPFLHVSGAGRPDLVLVRDNLQMRSLRPGVGKLETDRARQGLLHGQVPALVVGRVKSLINTGYAWVNGQIGAERREPT